jgi:hypothetical protein
MESVNVRDEVSTTRVSGWVKETTKAYELELLDRLVECAIEPRSGGIFVAPGVSPGLSHKEKTSLLQRATELRPSISDPRSTARRAVSYYRSSTMHARPNLISI